MLAFVPRAFLTVRTTNLRGGLSFIFRTQFPILLDFFGDFFDSGLSDFIAYLQCNFFYIINRAGGFIGFAKNLFKSFAQSLFRFLSHGFIMPDEAIVAKRDTHHIFDLHPYLCSWLRVRPVCRKIERYTNR